MFISLFFLAFALSIDAFGIGTSYGIKKIQIKPVSICIIFFISFMLASISVYIGKGISTVFSEDITSFISIFILIMLGIFIIKKGVSKNDDKEHIKSDNKKYSLFIKSLGITINVIKEPSSCDLDNSNKIEAKESIYLGIALSMDCMGVGISLYEHNLLFPLFLSIFQLLFLCIGILVGQKINIKRLDETKVSVLSGLILIFIGYIKIILL